jgi:hypothetical protein
MPVGDAASVAGKENGRTLRPEEYAGKMAEFTRC